MGLGIGTVALGGSAVRVLDHGIRSIAFQKVLAFPLAVWIAVAMFLLALFLERRTRLGRYIYAIGGGEDIAILSGVAVKRTRILAFTLAGFFTCVAAVLAAAQLGQANTTIADGRLFITVTAVVVGGTALTGGWGGVANSLVGVMIVAVLANGMVLLGETRFNRARSIDHPPAGDDAKPRERPFSLARWRLSATDILRSRDCS